MMLEVHSRGFCNPINDKKQRKYSVCIENHVKNHDFIDVSFKSESVFEIKFVPLQRK